LVDFDIEGMRYVVLKQVEPVIVKQLVKDLSTTGKEIIDAKNFVPCFQEAFTIRGYD
jgi:hypothetical protein